MGTKVPTVTGYVVSLTIEAQPESTNNEANVEIDLARRFVLVFIVFGSLRNPVFVRIKICTYGDG